MHSSFYSFATLNSCYYYSFCYSFLNETDKNYSNEGDSIFENTYYLCEDINLVASLEAEEEIKDAIWCLLFLHSFFFRDILHDKIVWLSFSIFTCYASFEDTVSTKVDHNISS